MSYLFAPLRAESFDELRTALVEAQAPAPFDKLRAHRRVNSF
jgi:hypothetical protein